MIGKVLRTKLIVLFSLLSLANGCKTTKTEAVLIPEVSQDIVQRMMTHPQIDKAWEHVPEFTRDVLKTISDQATQLELKNINNN